MQKNLAHVGIPHFNQVQWRRPGDDKLFAELAAVLDRHDSLDRFTIKQAHDHSEDGVPADMEMVEMTVGGVQVTQPMSLARLAEQGISVVETEWRLQEDGTRIPVGRCGGLGCDPPPTSVN